MFSAKNVLILFYFFDAEKVKKAFNFLKIASCDFDKILIFNGTS